MLEIFLLGWALPACITYLLIMAILRKIYKDYYGNTKALEISIELNIFLIIMAIFYPISITAFILSNRK